MRTKECGNGRAPSVGKRTAGALLLSAALVLGVGVSPASANAFGGSGCPGGASVLGAYYSGGGARSTEFLDCGSVGVQIGYRPYPGAPTLTTGFVFNPTNAYRANPGGQVYSNHRGTSQPNGVFFTLP